MGDRNRTVPKIVAYYDFDLVHKADRQTDSPMCSKTPFCTTLRNQPEKGLCDTLHKSKLPASHFLFSSSRTKSLFSRSPDPSYRVRRPCQTHGKQGLCDCGFLQGHYVPISPRKVAFSSLHFPRLGRSPSDCRGVPHVWFFFPERLW